MTTQTYEPKKEYVLTDGDEIFATRFLTAAEVEQLNVKAKEASEGNVWWEPKVKEAVNV